MILDAYLLLADVQDSTVSAASDSYIDTIAAGDANVGDWFVCRVETACTAAGAATATFALQTDSTSTFASATSLISSGAIGKASLTANTIVYKARIPSGVERYLRGYITIATGPLLTGTYDMFIVKDADINALLIA